jgi:glutathione peroxidase
MFFNAVSRMHKSLLAAIALLLLPISQLQAQVPMDKTIYQFTMDDISGNPVSLQKYEGKVVLIVNVASACGLTPQYEGIQALYEREKDNGLVVLGFPANNFMGQEPGTNEEIQTFCSVKYGVGFPMFSKISVDGKDMHPLYQFLTEKDKNGVLDANVTWNFQKFLIGPDGRVVASFKPTTKVESPEVQEAIEALLK